MGVRPRAIAFYALVVASARDAAAWHAAAQPLALPRRMARPPRATPTLGLLDALSDIAEYLEQLGGYSESFSEMQLKGEAQLEQPKGPREYNETTINVFLTGLVLFAAALLLGVGTYIKTNNIHTIFP